MDVRIDLTDRHQKHPDSVRDYAQDKVRKLTQYFDGVNHIEIILDEEHDQHIVEVIVSANKNLHMVGHASHENAMAAIDKCVDRLERQVVKAKERLRDHHRGEGARRS